MSEPKVFIINVRILRISSTLKSPLIKITLQFEEGEEKEVDGFIDQLPNNIDELISERHIFVIELIKIKYKDKKCQSSYCINGIKA